MIKGIIIDAGHGGIDSGAIGNGLQEKDLNLKASKYMYKRLTDLGIPAKMTRTDDEYLPKDERIKKVLELYNNSPNTILISNHINAGGGEGAEVVYALKNDSTLADLVLDNIGKLGQIKRKTYQRRLPENPNKDYYYILRETGNTEPILIEYGFIDNSQDANKLETNLENYVEGVVKAIAEYINVPYYTENSTQEEAKDFYIVKKNDTLYSISKKFNIPIDSLIEINNLKNNTLSIGQKLYLTKQEDNINKNSYIVEKGDTLYSIAENNNTTVNEIKKINNLTNNNISIGQVLLIPSLEAPNETKEDTYIVQKGDSLWKISQKYNTTVTDLIESNNLKNLNLQIGQKLLVPNNEIKEEIYIVKKGDTIFMGNNE